MSTIAIHYQGNDISIDLPNSDGANYVSPNLTYGGATYRQGTARLKVIENSKTHELGFNSNTSVKYADCFPSLANITQLDNLKFRVGNKNVRLGNRLMLEMHTTNATFNSSQVTNAGESYSMSQAGYSMFTSSTSASTSSNRTTSVYTSGYTSHYNYSTRTTYNSSGTLSNSNTNSFDIHRETIGNTIYATTRTASASSTTATWYTFSFAASSSVNITEMQTRSYAYSLNGNRVSSYFTASQHNTTYNTKTNISQSHTNYASATANRNNHTASGYNQTASKTAWVTRTANWAAFGQHDVSNVTATYVKTTSYETKTAITQGGTANIYIYTSNVITSLSQSLATMRFLYGGTIANQTRATSYVSSNAKYTRTYKDYPAPQAIQTVYLTKPVYSWWGEYSYDTYYSGSYTDRMVDLTATWHNFNV